MGGDVYFKLKQKVVKFFYILQHIRELLEAQVAYQSDMDSKLWNIWLKKTNQKKKKQTAHKFLQYNICQL